MKIQALVERIKEVDGVSAVARLEELSSEIPSLSAPLPL